MQYQYSIFWCGCWSRRKFLSVLCEDVGRRGGGGHSLLTAENSNIPFHPNPSLYERFVWLKNYFWIFKIIFWIIINYFGRGEDSGHYWQLRNQTFLFIQIWVYMILSVHLWFLWTQVFEKGNVAIKASFIVFFLLHFLYRFIGWQKVNQVNFFILRISWIGKTFKAHFWVIS